MSRANDPFLPYDWKCVEKLTNAWVYASTQQSSPIHLSQPNPAGITQRSCLWVGLQPITCWKSAGESRESWFLSERGRWNSLKTRIVPASFYHFKVPNFGLQETQSEGVPWKSRPSNSSSSGLLCFLKQVLKGESQRETGIDRSRIKTIQL